MGMTTPPRALTKEKFYKAWNEGKRTMKEIDPEFYKWAYGFNHVYFIGIGLSSIGMILFIIITIRILFNS